MRVNARAMGAVAALLLNAVVASALDRPADPVVLTGATLGSLAGISPGDLVAFRWAAGWVQIPVQVDERAQVNFNAFYNNVGGFGGGFTTLDYTDAGTHTGADPNATLDADDEVVFMARDAGARAPSGTSNPAGVVAGSGREVTITDPLGSATGWVYLFRRSGTLDPAAGQQYVDYDFILLSGAYLTTYAISDGPKDRKSCA